MEDHDGFEPTKDKTVEKKPFIMDLFKPTETTKGLALEVAKTFQDLAQTLSNELPEGNGRTMLLERLLDSKDSAIRILQSVKR